MSGPKQEDYVAYFGKVYIKDALDSHKTGMRVKLMLEREEDYERFKSFKKRRKGKAGSGQYRVYMKSEHDEKFVAHHMDMLFIGWSMSSANGAVVTFQIEDAHHWGWFRKSRAIDGGYTPETLTGIVMMFVELDDNGIPVDVAAREKLEQMHAKKKWPKGGPQSIRAARLCNQTDFHSFLVQTKRMESGKDYSPAEVADWMRKEIGIDSRAQLDHDEVALHRFEDRIHSPFIRWLS